MPLKHRTVWAPFCFLGYLQSLSNCLFAKVNQPFLQNLRVTVCRDNSIRFPKFGLKNLIKSQFNHNLSQNFRPGRLNCLSLLTVKRHGIEVSIPALPLQRSAVQILLIFDFLSLMLAFTRATFYVFIDVQTFIQTFICIRIEKDIAS